jgi:aspartate carbamoyltransferase catalytic subunit
MFFVSPPQDDLRLDDRLKQRLTKAGVKVFEFDSLDATHEGEPLLSQIDCMYMTRIQREHNSASAESEIAGFETVSIDP